ncbi:hypothetical protein PCHDS_000494300, partial [Plasmodium chabaudi adami]
MLYEYQHNNVIINESKLNEIKENIKLKVSLLNDSPPIVLNNTCPLNKKFEPLHNDYTLIESNPDNLLNASNKDAINYKRASNKYIELENSVVLKSILNNRQDQNDIKLLTGYVLSENEWVYRNVGFYQDKLLREKLKLCQ